MGRSSNNPKNVSTRQTDELTSPTNYGRDTGPGDEVAFACCSKARTGKIDSLKIHKDTYKDRPMTSSNRKRYLENQEKFKKPPTDQPSTDSKEYRLQSELPSLFVNIQSNLQ